VTVTLLRRFQALQWLRRLVAGLLSWWLMFDPRSIHGDTYSGKSGTELISPVIASAS
jgi:hypothetical protein